MQPRLRIFNRQQVSRCHQPRQQGVTILEMMIGLSLGLIISAGMLAMWLKLQSSTVGALQQSRLHQDLRAISHVMASDIRRAGYWGWSPDQGLDITQNPFISAGNNIHIDRANAGEAGNSCLTYSYDADHDGQVGHSTMEQFGFRLHDQAIEMRTGGAEFNCQSGRWQDITQSGTIITGLSFTLQQKTILPVTGCSAAQTCLRRRLLQFTISGHLQSRPEQVITVREQIRIRNDYLFIAA